MEPHFYNIDITWKTGRSGLMCSPELTSGISAQGCIEVATPPEFPKGIAGVWSPEHLFTASVASCLMTTFLSIAENSRLYYSAFTCHAKGKLDMIDGKMVMSEIHLFPEVTVVHESDREKAQKVLEKSERLCIISNSIKPPVLLVSTVIVDHVNSAPRTK